MGFPSIIKATASGFSCGVNLRYLAANLQEKLWYAQFPRGLDG